MYIDILNTSLCTILESQTPPSKIKVKTTTNNTIIYRPQHVSRSRCIESQLIPLWYRYASDASGARTSTIDTNEMIKEIQDMQTKILKIGIKYPASGA